MPTTQFASWLFERLHPDSFHYMQDGMGGGSPGGMGGGFFSVDSSLNADQADTGGPVTGDGSAPSSPSGDAGGSLGSADGMGPPGAEGMSGMGMTGGPGPPPGAVSSPTIYYLKHFVVIVHSAFAALLGLAGGVIAQIMYAARRDPPGEREARAT
jgi:hypothetical protein